jgi:hypothetical protein
VISGNEYWEDIVNFYKVKESWFRKKLGMELKNRATAFKLKECKNGKLSAVMRNVDREVKRKSARTTRPPTGMGK